TRLLAAIVHDTPNFGEARYNYGLALQRQEHPAEAVEQFRAAVRCDAKNPRYVFALGIALADRGPPGAGAGVRRGAELAPADAETHYNLALAMAANGDNRPSIGEFQKALELRPDYGVARRGLGIALMHEDRLREAELELRRACEIAPRDAEAVNNLGL